MKILFISSTCSKEKYDYIYNMRIKRMIDPSQKFFDLLLKGMANSDEQNITCISALPVSASCVKKKIWKKESEKINKNLEYIYLAFINGKIIRYITLYITCFISVCKWAFNNRKVKEKVIICDPLIFMCSTAARVVSKMFKIKNVAIVTDIPTYSTSMKQRKSNMLKKVLQKLYEILSERDIYKYDSYIFLVENMNNAINKNKVPYLIIEGSVDKDMENIVNRVEEKSKPRVVMYAGGIYEKFGIGSLIRAFHNTMFKDVCLHIYGDGTYVSHVENISREDSRIQYMGVLPVDEIIEKEVLATLLVNPRPVNEEFTKYSFPSKTLEYMVSGTPLLTTRLSGIPKEYEEYLYYFDDGDDDSMTTKLNTILMLSDLDLHDKGKTAKEFVLSKKNYIIQGNKIIKFIEKSFY